ncbi:MAG: sulfite exporter TauE/SafE family protein [Treponema sp.]|jgi:sulfite exporter TauE/SafE/copper chaperone CopZ/plastocyanin domain-containing protein|nr:sulfite exporter TauE/SafE family protein [Treponema sp.]
MQSDIKSDSFRIGGMTCVNCQNRIERELKAAPGVKDAQVNFNTGMASVTYDAAVITFSGITALVENLDYRVLDAGKPRSPRSAVEPAAIVLIILALYALTRGLGLGGFASAFPLAREGMGWGMLFVIGLISSVHCAAMCGGINLSQCIASPAAPALPPGGVPPKHREALLPPVLYNAGRIVSYTAVGVLVGALGSVISVSGRFQGIVQIVAGIFMVIMGINMLGLFPALRRLNPRLPAGLKARLGPILAKGRGGRSPLLVGLLNGLMPCGPLQAMQLYALSTGSPLAGGLAMFLFGAGTAPLMFGIGALSSLLSGAAKGPAFTRRVAQTGAVLITVMGMTMAGYGFNLSGFSPGGAAANPPASNAAAPRRAAPAASRSPAGSPFRIEQGVQIVNSTLSPGRYPAITVQQGIPVKWTINAPAGSINGCNNSMIIREYRLEHRFSPGENIIEFTPGRTGTFSYTCWMGMIRGSITVVEAAGETGTAAAAGEQAEGQGGGEAVPAGVRIPTDKVALAAIHAEGYQSAEISLLDDGIEPAVVVFQRSIPALWIIGNNSFDPGNSRLIFPAYAALVDMEQGENIIRLTPSGDFDFSTADNVFYGYVKVVDDLDDVDIEAVKTEVSEHETLIYPDAYFERGYADQ